MSETINADSRLCHRCVGEKTLKSTIKKIGTMADCSFCRKRVKTISLDQAAEIFDKVFDQNFVRTEDEPTGMEYTMSKESDYQWERSGEDIVELLQEVGHIEPEVAESIRQLLEDKHFDFDEAAMGEEGDFAPDSRYTDRKVESDEFHSEWRSFEESLKTKSRYFSKRATLTLLTLFNGIHRSTTAGNRPVILTAGPETSITSLFRARVFQDEEKLVRALERPDQEIGPPPPAAAVAGRMNARGISTFYGATDREVALSEVRPFVGSRVVTAKFDLLRPISLLDLEALSEVSASGSLFDDNHRYQMAKANFLQSLSQKMTAPVLPDAEIFEYLPTQVIAEYLASQVKPELDGILYPSAQTRKGKNNVVLFHESSLVEKLTTSDDNATFVETEIQTADGPEPEYWVFQRTAPKEEATDATAPFAAGMSQNGSLGDGRIPTLRIDLSSVEVHHIESVVYKHSDYQVHRSQD
jgi:RES domain-containing protein/sulfur carrier protein ThiS